MKKLFFAVLIGFATLISCQKPENDEALVTSQNGPIEAVAMTGYTPSSLIGVPKSSVVDTCNSKTFLLIAGQHTTMGTVVVSNDVNFLYVTYNTNTGWFLEEVHLYLSVTQFTERLNPGHAPFKAENLPAGTTTYTFTIPIADTLICGASIWLQAHAAVTGETAYGGTITDPARGSWYGNIFYTIECCTPPTPCDMSLSAKTTDVACNGASTGAIDLTVTNGVAPITYLWSNGATTEDLTGIPAGTYSVTVTSGGVTAAPCVRELKDIIISQPNEIKIESKLTNLTCEILGAIDITVTGGTSPYSYLWSTGATTEDLSGLSEGDYNVTVYDAHQCSTSAKFTLIKNCEKPKVIYAFARKTYEPMVHCFLSLDLDGTPGPDFTQWGWTNGALPEAEGFTSRYELFINAERCDIANATKVGDMTVTHFGGNSVATITMLPGFTMDKSALYMGNDILPKVGGNYTVDPANLPLVHTLSAATTDTYTITGLTGSIYIIAYVELTPEDN